MSGKLREVLLLSRPEPACQDRNCLRQDNACPSPFRLNIWEPCQPPLTGHFFSITSAMEASHHHHHGSPSIWSSFSFCLQGGRELGSLHTMWYASHAHTTTVRENYHATRRAARHQPGVRGYGRRIPLAGLECQSRRRHSQPELPDGPPPAAQPPDPRGMPCRRPPSPGSLPLGGFLLTREIARHAQTGGNRGRIEETGRLPALLFPSRRHATSQPSFLPGLFPPSVSLHQPGVNKIGSG